MPSDQFIEFDEPLYVLGGQISDLKNLLITINELRELHGYIVGRCCNSDKLKELILPGIERSAGYVRKAHSELKSLIVAHGQSRKLAAVVRRQLAGNASQFEMQFITIRGRYTHSLKLISKFLQPVKKEPAIKRPKNKRVRKRT